MKTNKIQALINLPLGMFMNLQNITTEDYFNFESIPKNALIIVDHEFVEVIQKVIKQEDHKISIQRTNPEYDEELNISILKSMINEFLVYNQNSEGEEIPIFIVGYKLWNIYKSIIDIVHVTWVDSDMNQESNKVLNEIEELGFEKSLSQHIPGEQISEDVQVLTAARDYFIFSRDLPKEKIDPINYIPRKT